jgi:hypothetical protein
MILYCSKAARSPIGFFICTGVFFVLVTFSVPVVCADPFLNVDFNTTTSPTELGPPAFSSFVISGTPVTEAVGYSTSPTITSGETTITLSSSGTTLRSFDGHNPSDSGGFTFGELYRDYVTTSGQNAILQIQVSGLNPNTDYRFTFYAYNPLSSVGITNRFTNTTGGVQPSTSGTIIEDWTASISSNEQFALTMDAVADGSGVVTFAEAPLANPPYQTVRLNGLQIAVPEPSVFALVIVGISGLLAVRRRVN